jgi:hypothetical protein
MKMKNLSTLAIVLVVLIGIIVIANQLQNRKPSEQSLVFLPQFSEATCSAILVVEGKDSAKIAKTGTNWFVVSPKASAQAAASPLAQPAATATSSSSEEYPADSAAVQTALDKIKNLKKDDLISQNAQKQTELEVDTLKGIFVEAWNDKGKSVGAFYIGKNGANWDSHFIREKGSNDVYLTTGSVRFSFFGDKKRWKDKTVIKFDKSFVKSIRIARKDSGQVELVKTAPTPADTSVKEGWLIAGPEKTKAKKDKVEEILNSFSKLQTVDFETDTAITADSLGFTKPQLVVSATLQSGETKTVTFGKKKGTTGQLWVKTPENAKTIFLVAEYNFNSLNQGIAALKDVPEVKKDANAPHAKVPAAPKKETKVKPATKKK